MFYLNAFTMNALRNIKSVAKLIFKVIWWLVIVVDGWPFFYFLLGGLSYLEKFQS